MKKNRLILLLKGFCIGGSMLVPGVSGGSMAIILGIYDDLIVATSKLFQNPKKSLPFLAYVLLGGLIGFVVVANPLQSLIAWNEKLVMFFFIGAVAGGIPVILKKAVVRKFSLRVVGYPLLGLAIIWLISLLPENLFSAHSGVLGLFLQFLGGIVSAVALVLPGISVSYLLVILGIYQPILAAIASMNVLYLLPFAAGLIAGIVGFIKLLEHLLNRHPKPTYLVILGFIVGSVAEIFPGLPVRPIEWVMGIVLFAAGFFAIYTVSRKGDEEGGNTSGSGETV